MNSLAKRDTYKGLEIHFRIAMLIDVIYLGRVMLTHSEAKRWASVMLKAALCDGMKSEEISRQVHLVCDRYGEECLEELIEEILLEAGRMGPRHSDGQLHHH